MAQKNYKNPPALGSDTIYETWKSEIAVWRLVTDLPKDRQALAVTLTLSDQARATALEIDVAQLNANDGMDVLLRALDCLFLKDTVDLAYEAYSKFDSYRKSPDITMTDFILEFEQRYTRCKKYDMVLPDAVLSFKLLDCANLSSQARQLALTASPNLQFSSMKSALKRIFSDSPGSSATFNSDIDVKEESAYFAKTNYRQRQSQGNSFVKPNISSTPRGTNPLNRFGKRTKCAICQSVFHWAKDCPHRSDSNVAHVTDSSEQEEHCNFTLFTRDSMVENTVFMTESFGCAIIDTACSRTVCGKKWLSEYLECLDSKDRESVVLKPSTKPFKFGDGKQIRSFQNALIPAQIGDTHCTIDVEVVESDLPLLLSKTSLKRASMVLDLSEDKAIMFNKPVQLQFTSSGHYCVDIRRNDSSVDSHMSDQLVVDEVLVALEDVTVPEKVKLLTKLHKQFGHASAERLMSLLKGAGHCNSDTLRLLTEIVSKCELCTTFKKQTPRPAVGSPLATDFNETVAVDLHQLDKNVWYLHIIDVFTKFSAGAIVTSKRPEVFVKKFLQYWVGVHGAPKKLFSDNGGEFSNSTVRDMCESLDIEIKTTPAMSPWSNGIVERHNQILTNTLLKVKLEQNCDWETALSWSLMAKNSLSNTHGFSSHQLVYGKNPNLPSVITNKLPALDGTTNSVTLGNHIAALHAARSAYTQSENSEKIRRAIRKQVRPYLGTCVTGDKIFYKRPDSPQWKGPATVIGQDGVVVFARHGGLVVRVHQCRVQKAHSLEFTTDSTHESLAETEPKSVSENDDLQGEVTSDSEDEPIYDTSPFNSQNSATGSKVTDPVKLKPGQLVHYKHMETGCDMSAVVLSRAGKATGKYASRYNLEYTEPEHVKGVKQSVDLKSVTNLTISERPIEHSQLDTTHENNPESVMFVDVEWGVAKSAELNSWSQNEVFEEVQNRGQKCITTKWVCTIKDTPEGEVRKARLVARGFEEIKKDEIQSDSPTCSKESLRLILCIIAQNRWVPHSMDVKTAFLQGQVIDRPVFVQPPPEAEVSQDKIWRLKKCVYGLNDASLFWYKKVREVMLRTGASVSKVDPAVFYWLTEAGELFGVLASHVDDFVWSGDDQFEHAVIDKVRALLNIGKEESVAFRYIGIELSCGLDEIRLQQDKYVDNLSPIKIEKSRARMTDSPLSPDEVKVLRSKVGQLLWVAHQSRPDVLFSVCQLASDVNTACVRHVLQANKVIKRVKSEKLTLRFQHLGKKPLSLTVFTDASLGNLNDGGTQGGYFIALTGENGRFSPVCWNSKKVRRVVRSSLAGETLAMADALDTGVFLSTLFTELTSGKPQPELLPITCMTDCNSLCEAIKSNKFVSEKRLRLEVSGIKELLERQLVKTVLWLGSEKQIADCLTKHGASPDMLIQCLETGILPM